MRIKFNFKRHRGKPKRTRNIYWAIRIANSRKPSIGYSMPRRSKRIRYGRPEFIYLGRWGAYFRARRY